MSDLKLNNFNNKYKLANTNLSFRNNPQEYAESNIPQGLIPNVQTTMPQLQQPSQPQVPVVQIPDIYYTPDDKGPKNVKEIVKQVDMMGMVTPWFENPLLMAGTSIGLSLGIDKYANSFGGEYEKSILGKATALGDKIENSNFIKKPTVQKVLGKIKKGSQKLNDLLNKSALIRAIRNTPAEPEWKMPKSELISQKVRILEEFHHIADTLHLSSDELIKVKNLGLDKAEKQLLKQEFKVSRISQINPNDVVNWTLLKRLELPESEIKTILAKGDAALPEIKSKILKQLGFTVDELADMHINPEKYLTKVKDSMLKTGKKVKIGAGHFGILGPFQIFERSVSCDQVGNKLRSIMDPNISKTGKFLAKAVQKIYRGFTFGGGKLGMCLWIAPSILMMLKDTVKAGWDEKIGTVVNGSFEAISWVFTFPLSIATMYALAGMEFAGMSKDQVKQYRDLIKNFNDDVLKGSYKNKIDYDIAKINLKTKLKGLKKDVGNQNLFTKLVRKVWETLNMDLGMIKPFQNGNPIMNLVRKMPNTLKNCFGVPLRFIICLFVIEGVYRKIIEKGSRTLFGRHYDHMKHEEHDAAKKEQYKFLKQDLQNRLYEAQAAKYNSIITPDQDVKQSNSLKVEGQDFDPTKIFDEKRDVIPNLVENNVKKDIGTDKQSLKSENSVKIDSIVDNAQKEKAFECNEIVNKVDNVEKIDDYTYIPSEENIFKPKNEIDGQKYIPSQVGINVSKDYDNSHLSEALTRADKAEQKALRILSGNFEGM